MSVSTSYLTGVALPMLIGTGLGLAQPAGPLPALSGSTIAMPAGLWPGQRGNTNWVVPSVLRYFVACCCGEFHYADRRCAVHPPHRLHVYRRIGAAGSHLWAGDGFIVRPFNRKSAAEKPVANRLDHLETEDA